MLRIAVGWVLLNFSHEAFQEINRQCIYAVIVVPIFREVAFYFKVNYNAVFVTDSLNFTVFDSRQGVSRNRETSDTCRHSTVNVGILNRHLNAFIAVLVVHVVDTVEGIDIKTCQPFHHIIIFFHYFIKV